MATPGVTLTGTLETLAGATNAGTVTVTLVNYGSSLPLVSGTAILAPAAVVVQAAGDGTFSVTFFGNYQIIPVGTFYEIAIAGADGSQVSVACYRFDTTGTYNLSTINPLTSVPGINRQSFSTSKVSHQWIDSYNALTGLFTQSQPAFSDISGVATAAQLPNPSATTLGGIESIAAVSHKWINSISTSGVPSLTQPDYSDLTGTPASSVTKTAVTSNWLRSYDSTTGLFTASQPAYTDITGTPTSPVTLGNAAHKWLNSYSSVTGLFTQTQPDYSDLTGTPALPANTTSTASQFFTAYNSTTGAFTKAQPAFTDISGTATTAQIPSLAASKITSGQLALAQGGTNADLSATGGASQVLKQVSSGAAITVAQLAFSDISGTATAAQYVTLVGDSGSGGTKGAAPAPGAGDAAAGKFLKADATWAVPAGGGGGGITNSAAASIVPVTTGVSGNLVTSPIWASSTEVRIGSTTNIIGNTSRLYVFGGTNGCNIDVQGNGSTAASDVACIEIEASDYDTTVNSISLRYQGPTALGTSMGFTNHSLALVEAGGTTTSAMLIRASGNFPIVFGTNDVERLRINATGESKFSSSLAITGAVNVSQVAAPAAPAIAPHNGVASTWAYKVVAYDNNNQPTTASTAGQTTTGPATLDATHWNQITWAEVAGASSYKVFRTVVATSPTTTGVIGTVTSGSVMTLRDNGLAGDSSSVPTANTTGEVTVPAIICNGPLIQTLVTKTTSYALTVNDRTVLVNSAGATTMTLPVTGSSGQQWTIKNINTGICTVVGASGTIEGSASVTLNPSNSFDVVFDGTNFWIV